MNDQELIEYKDKLMKTGFDPITFGHGFLSWYFYTDPDNDDIQHYDFESEKLLPASVLNNPACLEPIDLIELSNNLKTLMEKL